MFKKLCIATIVSTSLVTIGAETPSAPAIQSLISINLAKRAHIDQETKTIMFERQLFIALSERAEIHFEAQFGEKYPLIKEKCLALLDKITTSTEFAITLEQVTDHYITLIIEQNARFNDIIIDPSAFPLEQKIKDEVAKAAFDEQTEQLFNVFYITTATIRCSKSVLEKLAAIEQRLIGQEATLPSSDHAVTL